MNSVLFVCMGNICRSPTAEGIFRRHAQEHLAGIELEIDSAGAIGYHAGENADPRAIQAAKLRGYDLSQIISRQLNNQDFHAFDLIVAMDKANLVDIRRQAENSGNTGHLHKIKLLLEYAPDLNTEEVPDPYYGGSDGFNQVIDLIEQASLGLIAELKR